MANRQEVAYQSCLGRTLKRMDDHFIQEPLGDHYSIEDLPIKPLDQMGRTPSLTSFIEVVRGVEAMDHPHNMCEDMTKLPPPWGYAGTNLPHHELQVYTQPVGAGLDLVKLVQFPIRCYLPLIKSACTGEIYGLKMAKGQAPRLLQPCPLHRMQAWRHSDHQPIDGHTQEALQECRRLADRIRVHSFSGPCWQ